MPALFSLRHSGYTLPAALLWLLFSLSATALAQQSVEPACLSDTDTDSDPSADISLLLADAGVTPDFSLDDRSEPASLLSLLLRTRLPLITSESIPTGSDLRCNACHYKAWPQAPPATSAPLTV